MKVAEEEMVTEEAMEEGGRTRWQNKMAGE